MVASKSVITENRRSVLLPLFEDLWIPPIIRPVIFGEMGIACVDEIEHPTVCSVALSDFVMFAGDAKSPAAAFFVETTGRPCYVLPSSEDWNRLVRDRTGAKAAPTPRHSFSHERLDARALKAVARAVPEDVTVARFDEEAVRLAAAHSWSRGFIENFPSIRTFLDAGIGYAVFDRGEMVAGATSFAVYDDTIEIEVDTLPRYRRRGLATIASARLIGYCLDHGLAPHWDAANEASSRLAAKLGFTLERSYEVIRI